MKSKAGYKVFAPATVANLAVGFDILGLALDEPGDEIIARPGTEPGLVISKITGDKGKLSKEINKNTAGFAAQKLLDHLGESSRPVQIEIHKKMPFGTGMGSSAASAAAAVVAVNELLGRPLTKEALLPFAVEGEQVSDGAYHADNVAPSLLGGLLLIRDNATLDLVRLPIPKGLCVVVIYPHTQLLTTVSRGILSEHVKLKDAILQNGNIAAFVAGLYKSDFDLIQRSLKDFLIEPQRAPLIPFYNDIKEMSLKEGALGFNISGAGPSSFALCHNSLIAESIGKKAQHIYKLNGIKSSIYSSTINTKGATLY